MGVRREENSMETAILQAQKLGLEIEGKTILKDIDLSISKGEFVTITGPSGSGKSTLLQLVASMISPTSGDMLYKGKSINTYEPTAYRKEVSYCFQTATLFGETVTENLAFPYEIRKETFDKDRAIEALGSVGLSADYLDKKVTSLSGGEKQRIALIRNVLFLPEVLLLDEVTSALDAENRKAIGKTIRKLNKEKGVTILWVTHNTEEIAEANRKIDIVDGQVKE